MLSLRTFVFSFLLVAFAVYQVNSTPVAAHRASHSKLKSHLKTKLRDNTKVQAQGIQLFSGQEYQQCILRCQDTFRQCSLTCGVNNNPCLAEVQRLQTINMSYLLTWITNQNSTEVLIFSTLSATVPPCVAKPNVTVSPTIREHVPVAGATAAQDNIEWSVHVADGKR